MGTQGLDKAADYLAEQFSRLGLRTNLYQGTPFQEFEVPLGAEMGPPQQNRLTVVSPQKNSEPQKHDFKLSESFTPLAIGGSARFNAPLVFVGYGIVGRVLRSAVDLARERGIRAGLIRPLTLWPFPSTAIRQAAEQAERFFVVELSDGQMVDDVRIAVANWRPVSFYGRQGGNVPHAEEIVDAMCAAREEDHVRDLAP